MKAALKERSLALVIAVEERDVTRLKGLHVVGEIGLRSSRWSMAAVGSAR